MARSFWRRLALAVVPLLAGVACSGGGVTDPKDQLIDAMRAMGREPGVTLAISLDTDEESLRRIGEAGGEPAPSQLLALLPEASLRLSVPFDPEAKALALALRVGDADIVELRATEDVLYARADAPDLLRALGKDPAMADGARAMLAQTGVVPPEVVDGRWLALRGYTQMAEQMAGRPVDDPLDQLRARQAMERFVQVLADSSSVTRVGKDERGDQLRAAVPLREVYEAVQAQMEAMAPSEMPAVSEVPEETVLVELWVKDGRISAASVDAAQLATLDPEGPAFPEGARLAVRLSFERFDGVVREPVDAAELDPGALMSLVMGGMSMAFGESMAGMSAPSMPPGMPPGFDPSAPYVDPGMTPTQRAAPRG